MAKATIIAVHTTTTTATMTATTETTAVTAPLVPSSAANVVLLHLSALDNYLFFPRELFAIGFVQLHPKNREEA